MKVYIRSLVAALAVSLLTLSAGAQEGLIKVHQPGPAEGKVLSMHETILSREIYPVRHSYYWTEEGALASYSGREAFLIDEVSGEKTPYTFPKNAMRAKVRSLGGENMLLSSDGKAAYTLGQSLYIMDNDSVSVEVAHSENDQITYGQTVSRNEFGINGGIFWAPDGSKLAFYRKDESLVTDFPLLDINTRTGSLMNIKYPMNGMSSEKITLGVFDCASKSTVYLNVDDFGEDRYLTNVTWSPDTKTIYIQVLDRTQKHCRLNAYCATSGKFIRTLLTEDSEKYVEPLDPLYFIKGSNDLFIYRTASRDGYRNLYLCDTEGHIRRITPVSADVEYLGNNGRDILYTSAEVSPVENHLFSLSSANLLKAKSFDKIKFAPSVRQTSQTGWHSIVLSDDCTKWVDLCSSFNVPREEYLGSLSHKNDRLLFRSEDPLKAYATAEVDFGRVKSADGLYDNYYRLYKPTGFDPSKKYPVIVYVYGGPHSQMVQDTWLGQIRMWEMYMAQRGYIVYVQDNRGTSNQGLAYEQAIHRHCGQAEMADQMVGVNMLKSLPYVDASRIGVHGWSYGGFMTISLITNYPETFKVAVAGGPVIDWKWYEIMYGERYMDTEAMNPEGFAQTSLINKAGDLKGKLLICQGAVDNTVVWEHSLSFIRECIKKNVQVDYFPYPCAQHNVMGKDRVHLMDKVSMYFEDYL